MQKVVLVTGASTGIGFDSVRALIENNFLVVATVRKIEDENHLKEKFGERVKTIKIDLSDLKAIDKLPETLKHDCNIHELHGVINNAGIALTAPFAEQDFSEVQSMVQVNLISLMKVTQVLIPFLKKDSRIVNVSSVAGKSASPFLAVYGATKHAVEGFSVALRKELMLLGIKVVIIAPGSIKTPIWEKGFKLAQDKYQQTAFAESFAKFMSIVASQEKHSLDVDEVSRLVVHAMTSKRPCFRYAPIPRKWTNWYLPKLIPERIYDHLTAKVLKLLSK